jgi:hypothetical protein
MEWVVCLHSPIRLHGAVGNEALRSPDLFRLFSEIVVNICLFLRQQSPVGQVLLIHEVSRSHNDAPQSVGLLWTSDQLVAETST